MISRRERSTHVWLPLPNDFLLSFGSLLQRVSLVPLWLKNSLSHIHGISSSVPSFWQQSLRKQQNKWRNHIGMLQWQCWCTMTHNEHRWNCRLFRLLFGTLVPFSWKNSVWLVASGTAVSSELLRPWLSSTLRLCSSGRHCQFCIFGVTVLHSHFSDQQAFDFPQLNGHLMWALSHLFICVCMCIFVMMTSNSSTNSKHISCICMCNAKPIGWCQSSLMTSHVLHCFIMHS